MIDHSLNGKMYETMFKVECMKRGLVVLQPECAHLAFDVALFVGGKFLRIQVKGTAYLQISRASRGRGDKRRYKIPLCNHHGVGSYQNDVDFFAAYVAPLGSWYIVPIAMATSRSLIVTPGATKAGRAGQCKERWDYLMPSDRLAVGEPGAVVVSAG